MKAEKKTHKRGILYIVGTPIGNLEDITLRAIKLLNKVDLIAAEDTRRTARLLSYYFIHCPTISYHDRNKTRQVPKIIEYLKQGKDVAVVTDAGTPGISDPAYLLLQSALQHQIQIRPIPGVSAVNAALSVAGVATDRFTFYGYFPRKKTKRAQVMAQIAERSETAVLFEAPHRLQKTLAELAPYFPDRKIVIAREMTKIHEQYVRGSISEIMSLFEHQGVKGELTILIDANPLTEGTRGITS
ncbi:16S rRNA (cytidine(1402)-2'-O)-methyltransferase [candidate division CSSED10-310 bacterium]|uniref:Ribosomal RNA small subunit methyltransferase I n=1 Tax=candidate division CSSED10-310 bacterium TaxID=2855610 RepID=A0ABV6Z1J8_UNCC1